MQAELPDAPENEWFTPRVVNWLPERRTALLPRILQWVCYIVAFAGVVCWGWYSVDLLMHEGLTPSVFIALALMPVLLVGIGALIAMPALRRMIAGETRLND